MEVGVEATGQTVKNTMGTMSYHNCIACTKGWVSEKAASTKVEFAQKMLKKYPKPEDWD